MPKTVLRVTSSLKCSSMLCVVEEPLYLLLGDLGGRLGILAHLGRGNLPSRMAAWYAKLAITTALIVRSLGKSWSKVSMLKWCVRAR